MNLGLKLYRAHFTRVAVWRRRLGLSGAGVTISGAVCRDGTTRYIGGSLAGGSHTPGTRIIGHHCIYIYIYLRYYQDLWTIYVYERVAVGRKYPCTRRPRICLLWYLLQSLFHVQMGSNLNLGQSLYVQPLWLWVDDNLLAWSGAIHLYKKAIILAVNTAIYMVKVVLAGF